MTALHEDTPNDHSLADSDATRMLASGLARLQAETGATQKEVATELGYKSSVVLSHMALGRVPIPIDRAEDIARRLGLPRRQFLLAILKQRHPAIDFEALFEVNSRDASGVVAELEAIAGTPLDLLPSRTLGVLREAVASDDPSQRWITSDEADALAVLRGRKTAR